MRHTEGPVRHAPQLSVHEGSAHYDHPMHGELKDYRQPMVTSRGILLGFLLNFLAGWGIRTGQAVEDFADGLILGTVVLAVAGMLVTLLRILRADLGSRDPALYYRDTLRLYVASVGFAFAGLVVGILL